MTTMTRFYRFKQIVFFIAICFMSYIGLIYRVQVLLPANQKRSENDVLHLLDYEQTFNTQRKDAEDSPYKSGGKTETEETLHASSASSPGLVQDSKYTPQRLPREQSGSLNSTTGSTADPDTAERAPLHTYVQTHRNVHFVPVGHMYVFGTYLDLRQENNFTVRIFVLKNRKDQDSLVCYIADKGKKYTLYAQPYRMCENHGKEYEGWMYSCVLPNTMQTLPQHISVAPLSQRQTAIKDTISLQLKIIPPQTEQQAPSIGVCVPPLFGHLNLASIINFIQMCKVLGADRVFMYMGNVSSEIRKFLIYHSKKEVSLSVISWSLPENVSNSRDKLWYHGQLLAIQDCLYHNMAAFHFLLFIDLDEMLVPHASSTWLDMLDKIFTAQNKRSVAALSFKSAFFDPTRVPRDSENIVYFQHVHRTVSTSQVRNKLMVQPLKVFELGIHHLSKSFSKEHRSVEVSEKEAVIHHYRVCEGSYEPQVTCDLVTEDRRMLRYKDRLTYLSQRVITDASKLFA